MKRGARVQAPTGVQARDLSGKCVAAQPFVGSVPPDCNTSFQRRPSVPLKLDLAFAPHIGINQTLVAKIDEAGFDLAERDTVTQQQSHFVDHRVSTAVRVSNNIQQHLLYGTERLYLHRSGSAIFSSR